MIESNIKRGRIVTQKDIAAKAGVSQFAVSSVLRGGETAARFSASTRQRIIDAAVAEGYRPSRVAQALRNGTTGTIGLWMVRSHLQAHALYSLHLHQLARADKYHLLLSETTDSLDEMQEEEAWEWPADAVIAVDSADRIQKFREFRSDVMPIVSAGWFFSTQVDHVGIDLWSGSREAVDHLIATGRKRIVYLATANSLNANEPRCATYRNRLADEGLPTHELSATVPTREAGLDAMAQFLSTGHPVDAIFVGTEELAVGAYAALRRAGRRIPDDVALVSFGDEVPDLPYFDTPISAVRAPIAEVCNMAWTFLRERQAEPERPIQGRILSTSLQIRGSSRC